MSECHPPAKRYAVRDAERAAVKRANATLGRLSRYDRYGVMDGTAPQVVKVDGDVAIFDLGRIDSGSYSIRYEFHVWPCRGALPVDATPRRSHPILVCTETFPHRRVRRSFAGNCRGFRVYGAEITPELEDLVSDLPSTASLGLLWKQSVPLGLVCDSDASIPTQRLIDLVHGWAAVANWLSVMDGPS